MADPREHDQPDELRARAAAAISRSEELSERVGQMAVTVADTEDKVADVHERLAENPDTATAAALTHAARARRSADHERREQQRWSATEND
jgi:hypothetical protein